MRIHLVTSGAADMYCGSCLRDNALATALLAAGHDLLLIPTYTPTLTDEPNVSTHKVLFGGVSVYLEQRSGFYRRLPKSVHRLLDSWGLLKLLSRVSISTSPDDLGELTVSMLRGEHGVHAKEFEIMLEWLGKLPRPEVVSLPHSLLIRLAEPIRRAMGCRVCCALQGEDLFLEGLKEPYRSESLRLIRESVESVDGFIAVSEYYAEFMSGYLHIPRTKMHTVPLGINLAGYDAMPRAVDQPFTIGYFARVVPEKSLHLLAEAYRILRQERGLPASRLEAAGYLAHEYRGYLRGIERKMREWGLGDEFHYRGVLSREEKIKFLQGLDVISVPSSYVEPKGIYLLEAMGCGVPFVQPNHGAFPEIARKSGGGVLFEPGNVASLADALESLWHDEARRAALGRAGYDGVRRHFDVNRMAADTVAVYERVLGWDSSPRVAPVAARA
ncbi:MAG TPA: glycosyltransferase family 4 protein [Candidatus Acidoferrales bacterium]